MSSPFPFRIGYVLDYVCHFGSLSLECYIVEMYHCGPKPSLMPRRHASISQGQIHSDKCMCCRTEREVADPTLCLTLSQYTDTKPTSPSTNFFFLFVFFFFCVPQLYLWGSPLLGEIFAYVTVFLFFFYPTIKVVTFRRHGWCMLGVFLLPAFTLLGHERQDLLSLCDEMHVCTD